MKSIDYRARGLRAILQCIAILIVGLGARGVAGEDDGLPPGSQLDADALDNPREVFHSEAVHGHKPYLSNLGNLAFNTPYTLGATAQKAHLSCASCHVNGAANPKLFIPGLSTRPGNFDTSNAWFNAKADNGVLDAVAIPSLRGARFLGPYGHDGRAASLHDFVRNVIVNEFAGAEPAPQMLDALVAYIEDIDFLPNPNLDRTGRLVRPTPAQLRGQALFTRPFPAELALSCAACHLPSAAFVDHRQHDVGSGGLFKTPTLMNADFNAPYFHDGRFDTFGQVIAHFNELYDLRLSEQDSADLGAYLHAIGDGVRPVYHVTGVNTLEDINGFVSVLDIALAGHDNAVIAFTVKSVCDLLREFEEHYAEPPADSDGASQRALARANIAAMSALLRGVQLQASRGRYRQAALAYLSYRKLTFASAPAAFAAADPWSTFNSVRQAAPGASLSASGRRFFHPRTRN